MQENHSRVLLCENPHQQAVSVDKTNELVRTDIELIGIDEVRTLITEAHRKPTEGYKKKHIVLAGIKITTEAQQASLKILEEPPVSVSISLILPHGTHLLDTVLSRVEVQNLENKISTSELSEWLGLSQAKRIEVVGDKTKNKEVDWLQAMKVELQQYCKNNHQLSADELKELQLVVDNLLTRGASNKMLLEHLALSLPLTS